MSAPDSTIARLERAADSGTAVRFVGKSVMGPDGPEEVSWRQIHDEARAVGAALQARGLLPGDHVAVLGPTSRALMTVVRGCWLAGIASMVLPLPMRMGSLEAFIESTRARIRHGDAKLVLIDDQLADFYEAVEGDPPLAPLGSVLPGAPNVPAGEALETPPDDAERLVILQYTSGSTSEPKGVMIPDRVLSANIDACCAAAQLGTGEVMVSWLPLYHDMGLVGFLALPMTMGVDLVQAAPQDFLGHPGSWMQWISDYGGSATAGPNFSWVLATRALKRMTDLDLSSLTLALSGAEPVDPMAVEAFVEEAGRFGFQPGGVFPAFGMAEVAIGGSFPKRGVGLQTDDVDRVVLETARVAKPVVVKAEPREVEKPTAKPMEITAEPLQTTPFHEALEIMSEGVGTTDILDELEHNTLQATFKGSSFVLSAGFLTWALRGASLLASVAASLPAWQGFDPLPVLAAKKRDKKAKDEEDTDDETKDADWQEKRIQRLLNPMDSTGND